MAAARARGLLVTYVLYPDEGHGFSLPANSISSYAIIEAFLARHMGASQGSSGGASEADTRFEPIGDDLKGSTLKVEGPQHVPGLEAALEALR